MTKDKRPTSEQAAALNRFAAAQGRNWKDQLRQAWYSGYYPYPCDRDNDAAYLQQVRNQFGPSWLTAYKPEGGR